MRRCALARLPRDAVAEVGVAVLLPIEPRVDAGVVHACLIEEAPRHLMGLAVDPVLP